MARHIDPDNLKPQDKAYLEQRPWLIKELELQLDEKFDDIDFGIPKDESDGDQSNADRTTDQELAAVRRENAALKGRIAELEDAVNEANDNLAELQASLETEDEEEVKPYPEWDYDDLADEVKRRNAAYEAEDVETRIKPESRSTENLIRALEADDNSQAASEG